MPRDVFSRRRRLVLLLIAIVALLFAFPYVQGSLVNDLLLNLLEAGIVLSAVVVVSSDHKYTWVAATLGTFSLISGWLPRPEEHSLIFLVGSVSAVAFYAFAVGTIVAHLLREFEVTFDLLCGALCAYLLLGFLWAEVYGLLEFCHPHSIVWASSPAVRLGWSDLLYFSFMTLTEAGYGDANPMTAATRSIAILESVSGVFYVAVMLARLVGMHVATHRNETSPKSMAASEPIASALDEQR